jgi:hypothetical protein
VAVGVSVDTHNLPTDQRLDCLQRIAEELGLPAVDSVATGVGPIVDRLT